MKKLFSILMSILMSILVFVVLNLPSIKLIYSSSLLNVVSLFGIWIVGILRTIIVKESMIKLTKNKRVFLIIFTLLGLSLLFPTLFSGYGAINIISVVKYVVIYLMAIGIIVFLEYQDIKIILVLQILWGFMLSYNNLLYGISFNEGLGQTYLTAGVPIAAAIITSISIIFYTQISRWKKTFIGLLLIVVISGVISLNGRLPFILSIAIPSFIALLVSIFERGVTKKVHYLLTLIVSIIVFYLITRNNISEILFERLLSTDLDNNSRTLLFQTSVSLIESNPFGYGLDYTINTFSFYPHNIFLEIAVSGGIFSFLLFSILIAYYLYKSRIAFIAKKILIPFSLFIYYLLTWNVSFDLSSSYILFTSLAILIIMIDDTLIKIKKFQKNNIEIL